MKPKINPPNAKAVTPTRTTPVAPPVYRPQPLPLVAQRKSAMPKAPPIYRPQPAPRVLQTNGIIQRAMAPPDIERPNFSSATRKRAILGHMTDETRTFDVDEKKPDLRSHNAAIPHRMSWKDIRDSISRFAIGIEKQGDFERWTNRFIEAGKERIKKLQSDIASEEKKGQTKRLERQQDRLSECEKSQDKFIKARIDFMAGHLTQEKFVKVINDFHANVPDLGPHNGVNNVVGPCLHPNLVQDAKKKRSLSPGSRAAARMSPQRMSGVAVTTDGNYISTKGEEVKEKDLDKETKAALAKHKKVVIPSFDPKAQFGK